MPGGGGDEAEAEERRELHAKVAEVAGSSYEGCTRVRQHSMKLLAGMLVEGDVVGGVGGVEGRSAVGAAASAVASPSASPFSSSRSRFAPFPPPPPPLPPPLRPSSRAQDRGDRGHFTRGREPSQPGHRGGARREHRAALRAAPEAPARAAWGGWLRRVPGGGSWG